MKLLSWLIPGFVGVVLSGCGAKSSESSGSDDQGQPDPSTTSSGTSLKTSKNTSAPPISSSPAPDPNTLVALSDCSIEAALKSTGGGQARKLIFVNNTSGSVTIYWINPQGQRVAYATLATGGIHEQGTYTNHPWVVADGQDRCKVVVPNTSPEGNRVCIGPADGTCTDPPTDASVYPDYDPKSYTNCKVRLSNSGVSIGGFPRSAYRLNSTRSVIKILFADFSDSVATKTPEQAYTLIAGAPDTFKDQSYGKFDYAMTPVYKWYRLSRPLSEYVNFDAPEGRRGPVWSYLQEVMKLADPDVDFSKTDGVVIIANPDAKLLNIGPAHPRDPGGGITVDGREILNFVTSGYDLNHWGSIWLNHEATHTLGLPDLYAYVASDPSNRFDSQRFAGQYSYMAYNGFDGNAPALTAWERWILGWLDDNQMPCWNPYRQGEVTQRLTPVGIPGGIKSIVVPMTDTKVAVVESRRRTGLDKLLRKEGALVYTIDAGIASGMGPLKVYPIDASDLEFYQSPRAAGESVKIGALKVEVLSSDSSGDTVRVSVE